MSDWRWVELAPGVWVQATVVSVAAAAELQADGRNLPATSHSPGRWVEIMPGVYGPAAAATSEAR